MLAVFANEVFGFHVQQAAEKLFKAWLALLGETYPTTHNLARLLEMLSAHGVEAERFDQLVDFTPYAVQFRYSPGESDSIPLGREEAIESLQAAARGCSAAARRPGHPVSGNQVLGSLRILDRA